MCHGKFLYLVSEREGAVRAGGQEAVAHAQLAQVGHDEAGRAPALGNQQHRRARLNVQQHARRPLGALSHLSGRGAEVKGQGWHVGETD